MNFTRKTLFWFIVLIVLGGAFFFFDKKQEAVKQSNEEKLKLLPTASKDISEFWISYLKENRQIKAVREKEGWRLVQPLTAKGDVAAIDKLLTNVVTSRKDAVLFEKVEHAKLVELGLGDPEVEMGLKSASSETVIVFGEKGPTNNVAYAMFKGRPEVYRVHSDLKKEVSKDVYALRDKNILDFDPTRMKRLEIEKKGMSKVVIEQNQAKWNMLEPAKGIASMAKVMEYLYTIKNGEIKAFVDENPPDLAPYGLSQPMIRVTIFQEQQETPYILTIGIKDRAKRAYYAKANRGEKVFDVDEGMVDTLILNMDKLLETGAGS